LFEELEAIAVKYADTTVKMTGNDCSGVVFARASDKYHAVLTSEKCAKGTSLIIDDLEDDMNQLWRQ
jgi:hypothetical protein